MTAPTLATPDALLDEVVTALRRDDVGRAERAVAAGAVAGIHLPPVGLARLAALNARRRRWADAAWLWSQLRARDEPQEMQYRLARNLASLQRHRPDVYATLADLGPDTAVTTRPTLGGRFTVAVRRPDGSLLGLSPGGDPVGAAGSMMTHLAPALRQGNPIGLAGVGDGYLLAELASDRTPLFLGMKQPVFVIEPDARVLFQCLTLHDYTGPAGPLEQERFIWLIGPAWATLLCNRVLDDPWLGIPVTLVPLGLDAVAVQQTVNEVVQQISRRDLAVSAAVQDYYARPAMAARADLFGSSPPRRLRVLLLTTRFSTVLQYSTRDTADAFSELGWEAEVLIEPTTHHRLFGHALRRAIERFKPDLMFQIDHLRHEHGDMFPPGLPFVCWIQDHLPHLSGRVGMKIGRTDFVLTDTPQTYIGDCAYPARQVIAMPKLTRGAAEAANDGEDVAGTPSRWLATDSATAFAATPSASCGPADDVVFVSNASRTPESLLLQMVKEFQGNAAHRDLMAACGQRVIERYAAGDPVKTYVDVRAALRDTALEQGLELTRAEWGAIAPGLYHPLCDALYRQEALRWAADAARRLGLSLGLYGAGWAEHPELAPHARGPIEYGPALAALTRRTPINLQIVPYLCLHQRLLDGLMAGGFFLVREHPADLYPQTMSDFLAQWVPTAAGDARQVRAALPSSERERFETLLRQCERCLCPTDTEDAIEVVRAWEQAGFLRPRKGVLPDFEQVCFESSRSLYERLTFFMENAGRRAKIASAQRRSVASRFTYTAGMQRVIRVIRERLAENLSPSPRSAIALQRQAAEVAA